MEEGVDPVSDDGDSYSDLRKKPAVNSKKRPPPESVESTRTRGLIIVSFWAIIICLGLPIWWRTTSIHRARLPLREMLDWADGKVSRIDTPSNVG